MLLGSSLLRVSTEGTRVAGMSSNAMVAQAAKLDLVSNVFVNGVHGNLIYQDFEVRPSPSHTLGAAVLVTL